MPAGADWRDVPLPAGAWNWAPRPGGGAARFGLAGQAPLAVLACDRAAGVVRLVLSAGAFPAKGPHTALITASTSSGTANADVQPVDGLATITLPASSRLLDAMAFSRGRFRVAIDGSTAIILPNWSEVGRVVEDCRG